LGNKNFEVKLSPNKDFTDNNLTNVQFTVKWPENKSNLINISSDFNVFLQGSVNVDGGFNYAVFATVSSNPINWTAGSEYSILSFSHDDSGAGYADFEIADDNWTSTHNGVYYSELLGLDQTGSIFNYAQNVYVGIQGEVKVMLQAPYDAGGMMNASLLGNIPLNQPYSREPWNYDGTESILEMDDAVVDWVLLELRSDPNTTVEKKAALLLEDGSIVQYNHLSSGVYFDSTAVGSLFHVVVHHRNHMPVMTDEKAVFDGSLIDFTNESICYGYPGAEIELETGIYGLVAGDINSNGILSYSGPGNDRGLVLAKIVEEEGTVNTNEVTNGYFDADVSMDYEVKYIGGGNDRAKILTNLSALTGSFYLNAIYPSPVPILSTKSKSLNDGPFDIFIDETEINLQVKIITNEDVKNGIVDNVQFTLFWDNTINSIMLSLLENAHSSFGIQPQGLPTEYQGKMYQVFVSVVPVELPVLFEKQNEEVLIEFTKTQSINVGQDLNIANNTFTDLKNGMYYISLFGKDFTGTIINNPLGLDDEDEMVIHLYPNPVLSGILYMDVNRPISRPVDICILDIHGKVVYSERKHLHTEESNNQIDLRNIPGGMYYIKLESSNFKLVRKLIIL